MYMLRGDTINIFETLVKTLKETCLTYAVCNRLVMHKLYCRPGLMDKYIETDRVQAFC